MAERRSLPSALEAFEELLAELGRPFAVFLDFDGTLSPIVADPEEAWMPEATGEVLARLAEHVPVAVVSGREVDDVRRRVGLGELVYVGDHGFAVRGPVAIDGLPRPEGLEAALAATRQRLEAELDDIQGVRVEEKSFSLAVHHRQAAPSAGARVQAAVEESLADEPVLRWRAGKQVVEVVPAVDWNKGRAVERLRTAFAGEGPEPAALVLGDDVTDEAAFARLGKEDVGVLVAEEPRQTQASYRLRDPHEVRAFLARLSDARSSDAEP